MTPIRPINALHPLPDARMLALEVETAPGAVRLVLAPATISSAELDEAVAAELDLRARLDQAFRAELLRMRIGGVARAAGFGIDFVVRSRTGDRRVGVHALYRADGLDADFVRRLCAKDDGLDRLVLLIVCRLPPAPPPAPPSVQVVSTADQPDAPARIAGRIWNNLATDWTPSHG